MLYTLSTYVTHNREGTRQYLGCTQYAFVYYALRKCTTLRLQEVLYAVILITHGLRVSQQRMYIT